MAGLRVSDPSRLHLKKELSQIKKAARVLRDPGTTSSWKSPLNSSRSMAACPAALVESLAVRNGGSVRLDGNVQLDSQFPGRPESFRNIENGKEKVFLYNWKTQKSSSEKSGLARNAAGEGENEDDNDGSSWIQGSIDDGGDDDDMSDARNCGDSKSDTYTGDTRPASMIVRRRDTNPVSPGVSKIKKSVGSKKRSKKNSTHLDFLSRYQSKEAILNRKSSNTMRFPSSHRPALTLGAGRDDSAELSDGTEDYSNSGDLRKISGASPLLLKLKHKNWSRSSTKFLKTTSRKEDSSYTYNSTPALSTSSYNIYAVRNPSTVGSWDAATTSLNDDDKLDGDNLDLPGGQGCGIPCYWTKRTPKHRGGCRSCCSPSLSDTLRRTGSSILCGSRSVQRRHKHSSRGFSKKKVASRSAQGVLPLLNDSADGRGGSSIGTGRSDDELSTNFGELELEAQSRLDGRRWSTSCRSQHASEVAAINEEEEDGSTPENGSSLSKKYRPRFFDELIGQNIVVQSLMNAVTRGRIAPVYLFQGPRGTGKSSTARIFAAALNCAAAEAKPCGYCRECTEFISKKSKDFWETDATNKKGAEKVRYLLKNLPVTLPPSSLRYKVFVIGECHLLPSKTWLSFLKFLENPPQKVVFIFITSDLDSIPRTIQSRCQKYLFSKLKDADIVARLRKIACDENLEVESQAFELIALNADGSLRDAETMLEQLSYLGKRITTSLVNELVGVAPDEKLLELLELAMSSDTAETVKRARELLDLGADPVVMMSQLASLIMDIIAGTYKDINEKYSNAFLDGRNLTEADLEKLKHVLKLLFDAEKQLRVSSDRSTWFTATLLQLGSMPSPGTTQTGSNRRQSSRTTEDNPSSVSREVIAYKQKLGLQLRNSASPASMGNAGGINPVHERKLSSEMDGGYKSSSCGQVLESDASIASHDNTVASNMILTFRSSEKLNDIWIKCIEKCHSKTLRQLLYAHGKLLSISEVEGILVAYIAFGENNIRLRAERFLSSITNSIEMVLRQNVEVRIILLPETELLVTHQTSKKAMIDNDRDQKVSTQFNAGLSCLSNAEVDNGEASRQEIPMQRIESIIREQRLETAWLQATEKGTRGSIGRIKPEKNQILPQQDTYRLRGSAISSGLTSQRWGDETSNGVKVLKISDAGELQKAQTGKKAEHYPLSPSLLHNSNFTNNKDTLGYESGSGGGGCSMLFCWNTQKTHHQRSKVKGTPVGSRRSRNGRFSLFSGCAKPRKTEGKLRR